MIKYTHKIIKSRIQNSILHIINKGEHKYIKEVLNKYLVKESSFILESKKANLCYIHI